MPSALYVFSKEKHLKKKKNPPWLHKSYQLPLGRHLQGESIHKGFRDGTGGYEFLIFTNHFCSFCCKWFSSCSKRNLLLLSPIPHNFTSDRCVEGIKIIRSIFLHVCKEAFALLHTYNTGKHKTTQQNQIRLYLQPFPKKDSIIPTPSVRHKPASVLLSRLAAQFYLLDARTKASRRSAATLKKTSGLSTAPTDLGCGKRPQ